LDVDAYSIQATVALDISIDTESLAVLCGSSKPSARFLPYYKKRTITIFLGTSLRLICIFACSHPGALRFENIREPHETTIVGSNLEHILTCDIYDILNEILKGIEKMIRKLFKKVKYKDTKIF
jgi:hypothetical protein